MLAARPGSALSMALQDQIQAATDELVAGGGEIGLQVAVTRHGELVAEAVSGVADPADARPVTPATLFFAASAAKGVASTVAHVLAERGQLDYDLRLAEAWPEFGVRGKETATVRHVLLHTAGVPGLPPSATVADLCAWDRICAAIADLSPWWVPGTRYGYHALTFGYLIGEVIRRRTGATISEELEAEITGPLGLAGEVCFGVPAGQLAEVARQVPPDDGDLPEPEPGSPADRAIPVAVRPDAAFANRADVLTADIPSLGTMTARGVALLYAGVLGYGATPLVSAARLQRMAAVEIRATDQVMKVPAEWTLGYSPARPGSATARPGSVLGMLGGNGAAAYADIDSGITVAVLRNRFSPDFSAAARVGQIVAGSFS